MYQIKPPEVTARVREILFVELLGGLGDVLIALSAIQALARSHPEARLTVLTFPPGGELLKHDPLIHEVVHVPRPDPTRPRRAREAVEEMLAQRRWDLVVSDTSYDGTDALISSSGVLRTVTNLWRSPPPDERVGERFLRLLLAEGLIEPGAVAPPRLHLAPEERSVATEKLADARRPLAFLIPDAGMEVKRWPEESWGSLGRALCDRYGAGVVVPVGSDPEQATRVVRLVGGRARVWPRGTLRELAAGREGEDGETGLAVRAGDGLDGSERDQDVAQAPQEFHEQDLTHASCSLRRFDLIHARSLAVHAHLRSPALLDAFAPKLGVR